MTYVYKCTTAGTSQASRAPTRLTAGTVTTGTAVFTFNTQFVMQVGLGVFAHEVSNLIYGAAFATNAAFYGSVIDCCTATFTDQQGVTQSAGTALRLGPNQNIDWSGQGTQATQNLRKLGYSSSNAGLAYTNTTGLSLLLRDSGNIDACYSIEIKGALARPMVQVVPATGGMHTCATGEICTFCRKRRSHDLHHSLAAGAT